MLREEALAGFHAGPLSWSNRNFEMWSFCGVRETGEPGKTLVQGNKLNPHMAPGRNRTRAPLVGICSPGINVLHGNGGVYDLLTRTGLISTAANKVVVVRQRHDLPSQKP